jgi:hypothetical protein
VHLLRVAESLARASFSKVWRLYCAADDTAVRRPSRQFIDAGQSAPNAYPSATNRTNVTQNPAERLILSTSISPEEIDAAFFMPARTARKIDAARADTPVEFTTAGEKFPPY